MILSEISRQKNQLKIILKTKDETSLLSDWIKHHINIVGPRGLIIFDNMSDNPQTFEIYDEYCDLVQIFQFKGLHNSIHDTRLFNALYRSIRESSKYFSFLDTDEFLYWNVDGVKMICDPLVAENIVKAGLPVLPGIWIENAPNNENSFLYTFRQNRVLSGIKGGKPFFSNSTNVSGFINHNIQVDANFFRGCQISNLVVHHRKHLSASQRTKANLNKLRSYNLFTKELEVFGLIKDEFSIEDLLAIDVSELPFGNARNYIAEIKDLSNSKHAEEAEREPIGFARLADGRLIFSNKLDEVEIRKFIDDPTVVFQSVFQTAD